MCHNVRTIVNYKIIWLICLAHEHTPISIYTIQIVLVLGRFDLQPNIRERNPFVKRDPTVCVCVCVCVCIYIYQKEKLIVRIFWRSINI